MTASAPATLPCFRDVLQVAVITPDARRAMTEIGAALGAGSFKVATLVPPLLFDSTYGGEPGDGSMRVGVTWIGNMLLEVIQPLAERNVYAAYLARRGGRPGVQHIFIQHAGVPYEQATLRLARAGYAPKQHGRLNASARVGGVRVPPMPSFLAKRLATRFCYTSTHDTLGIDIELAQFGFGVPYRAGLRFVHAEEWIPEGEPRHFESSPADALLRNIDAVYVLCDDVEATSAAYAKLTDRPPEIGRFADDVLPGEGRIAEIRLTASAILLVEPKLGPLGKLRAEAGDGVQLVRGRANGVLSAEKLRHKGWAVEPSARGLFAKHAAVPFALWVTADAG